MFTRSSSLKNRKNKTGISCTPPPHTHTQTSLWVNNDSERVNKKGMDRVLTSLMKPFLLRRTWCSRLMRREIIWRGMSCFPTSWVVPAPLKFRSSLDPVTLDAMETSMKQENEISEAAKENQWGGHEDSKENGTPQNLPAANVLGGLIFLQNCH